MATWREAAYPLLGLVMSIVVFTVLVTPMSLGLGLLMTLVGLPILLGTASSTAGRRRGALARGLPPARAHRRAVPGRVEPLGSGTACESWRADPQTWKDYAWLMVLCVVGFAFGVRAPTIAACSRCSRTSARPAED